MIKPIKKNVVVLVDEREEKTAGGIIIPGKPDEVPPGTGIIMAVGSEVEDVEVGQRVVFRALDGHDVKIDGKEYTVLKDFNILGVFTDGN